MIDFFHKGASMTKKVTGIAKIEGAPEVESRPAVKITETATFYDEEDKIASILLEVADTEEKRKRGLMGRKSLPPICGMLFTGLAGPGHFWMKNCLIPLDVMFMDANATVTKTYSMPVDKDGSKHYNYDEDDVAAIEVPHGFCSKWGIKKGTRVELSKLSGGGDED